MVDLARTRLKPTDLILIREGPDEHDNPQSTELLYEAYGLLLNAFAETTEEESASETFTS